MPATVGVLEALKQKGSQERAIIIHHTSVNCCRGVGRSLIAIMERGNCFFSFFYQMSAYNCRGVERSLSKKTMEIGVKNCQYCTCKAHSKTFNIFSVLRKQLVGLKLGLKFDVLIT